jgi:uncharacterized protein YecT (DUF1311 family)
MSKLALIGLGWVVLGMNAQAASFDCGKAQTKVEHLICDNSELSKLDEDLSTAYKAALKYQERADFIKRYQGKWLIQRNQCSTLECVKRLYEKQLLVLPSPISGSAVFSTSNKFEGNAASSEGAVSKPGFGLIRGRGVKVCDAYEKNLNSFINPINKYNQINPKFNELSQPDNSYLDAPPDSNIYPEMLELVWERDLNPADIISHTFWRGTREEYRKAEDQFFYGQESKAFSPVVMKVDIDNDGVPMNVILATFCGSCRHLIFVAQDNMLGLDYEKTRLLIKHPTVAERGMTRCCCRKMASYPGANTEIPTCMCISPKRRW